MILTTFSILQQLGIIAATAAILMFILWLVQLRTKDAGIVDAGWAASLGLAAVFAALTGTGDERVRAIAGTMGAVWGLRLSLHILTDRVLKGPEDGRYQMLRRKFGPMHNVAMLIFFMLQAVFVVVLVPPFLIASATPAGSFGVVHAAGAALWVLGLGGEWLADHQLKAFKANPTSKGKTCRSGLWKHSRHPNYFFEWLMWCAYAIVAIDGPHWYFAFLAPAIMLLLVTKVTGIPPTEARALETRGDDYRDYQRTTSAFVPWFAKPAKEQP